MRPPLPHQGYARLERRAAPRAMRGRIVHLTLQPDEGLSRLLGPTTSALSRSGHAQTVIVVDDPAGRHRAAGLDAAVDIVRVPQHRNPLAQWRMAGEAFAAVVDAARPAAVHFHGHAARVLGERVLRRLDHRVPTFHTPDRGGALRALRPLSLLARLLGIRAAERSGARDIRHGASAAPAVAAPAGPAATVVEGPVDAAYFDAVVLSARRPLIVAASHRRNGPAAAAFDQLAVLLGGDALGLAFNWIGPLDEVAAARMRAANVGVFDPHDAAGRAARLAAAWVYVALGGGTGFAWSLAEAMACGVPCVALDTPAHRSLVRQGETGYLCRSQAEIIDRIAQLADTPTLRERQGRAGRALARERFGEDRFRDTLVAAYSAPARGAPALPELRAAPGRR